MKLAVADTYLHYEQLDGGRLSLSKIASEHLDENIKAVTCIAKGEIIDG